MIGTIVIYEGREGTIITNHHNGTYDIEISGTRRHDPDLPMSGLERGEVIICVYRDEFEVVIPAQPRELEEHCSRCNRPLFTGDGRYRMPNDVWCESCGDENKEEIMTGIVF